jgi:hypothetical protein
MTRQSVVERRNGLSDALSEVERIAGEFLSELDRDNGSEKSRIRIGGVKRQAHRRLPALLKEAAPEIQKRQFWGPGLMEQFHEIWLSLPAVIQGENTWLAYLGNIRQLLFDALAADSAAAPGSQATRVKGKPGVTALAPEERPKGNWRVPQVAERWNVARKTVSRRFRNEPGVIRLRNAQAKKGHSRERDTLLIPTSVLERVERSMSVPDKCPA